MIQTLGLLLLGIATLVLSGYAPTLLLLDRRTAYPRVLAMPIVGLASYIVLTHFLANLGLSGEWISRISPTVFAVLLFVVPRNRRLELGEINESLPGLAICCAALLLAGWPMLVQGQSSYIGFGNPDAAYNLSLFDGVQHHPYRDNISPVPYWPGTSFGFFFGAGYICVLLASITGVDIFGLHDVVSALLVFITPASVFIFSLVCLKSTRRNALLAAVASAGSSLVCYTFYLQSFGALTLIAFLPAFLAVSSDALENTDHRRILLAALTFVGAIFGYYAATPMLLILAGAAAAIALAQRTVSFKRTAVSAAAFSVLPIACFPALTFTIFQRAFAESGSSRLVASLNGPELLLSFGFALTEQCLPFVWGLMIPPFTPGTFLEAPSVAFFFVLALSVILSGLTLWCLLKQSGAPLTIRAQMGILIVAYAYFVFRNNGYGAMKLAAWFNPVFAAFLISGAASLSRSTNRPAWLGRIGMGLFLCAVVLNCGWSVRLGAASLQETSLRGSNIPGYTAADFIGLSSLSKVVPADSRILVAIPDAVVQRWALTTLRRGNLSVVPLLSLSPEQADAAEQLAAENASAARYVLTLQPSNDITSSRPATPIWQNSKFQLLPIGSVEDLLLAGRGWYRKENAKGLDPRWQGSFRALRSDGELILFNASGNELRLRLTVLSGVGNPAPDRSISLSLNGQKFDEITTSGVANIVTKPFRAQGPLNRLRISLSDSAEPIPRKWGLFRRWVPKDARRLNLVVLNAELVGDQEYQATRFPCRLDLTSPDAWRSANLNGVYADRWIATMARVSLETCGEADSISIRGFAPSLSAAESAIPVTIGIDGAERTVNLDKPGQFAISIPLDRAFEKGSRHNISIGSPRMFVPAELGLGLDRRRLSVLLDLVEFHNRPHVSPDSGAKRATGTATSEPSRAR